MIYLVSYTLYTVADTSIKPDVMVFLYAVTDIPHLISCKLCVCVCVCVCACVRVAVSEMLAMISIF